MRYVIIIIDGEAVLRGANTQDGHDLFDALDGAQTPSLDAMGRLGRIGTAATAPAGLCSFGQGALSLLGYRPEEIAGVSGAVIAAASGTGSTSELGPGDWAMRLGLVSVSPDDNDGALLDVHGASEEEARALLDDLFAAWRDEHGERMAHIEILGAHPDWLFVHRAAQDIAEDGQFGVGYAGVETIDPSSIVDEQWIEHLPDGGVGLGASFLCELISTSRHMLADHPVNIARREQGLQPINLAWMWNIGSVGDRASIDSHVGDSVACMADCDAGVGVSRLLGCQPVVVEGRVELVESVLASDAEVVVAFTDSALEDVDREIVGPLISGLAGKELDELDDTDRAEWRVMVAVSHDPHGSAGIGGGQTPFVVAGRRVRSVVARRLSGALGSDLRVDPAHELLEYVLRSGLRGSD